MTGILKCDTIQDTAGAFEHARLVQVVNVIDSDHASGTTVIPEDNTIPQITEGTEFMTLAITPTNASNKLLIQVICNIAAASSGVACIVALFQDTTAGALACSTMSNTDSNDGCPICINHYMTAGTTSSTTFKVRGGKPSGANAYNFNGVAGARLFGGVYASSITISEIRV